MAVSAVLFSTEAEFDAATVSEVCSYLGVLRFGVGGDFSSGTNWTATSGTFNYSNGEVRQTGSAAYHFLTRDGTSSFADGTVRARVRVHANEWIGVASRIVSDASCDYVHANAGAGSLQLRVTGHITLASTAKAYANLDVIDLRIVTSGTTIDAYDDTNALSLSAVDANHGSGSIGIEGWGGHGSSQLACRQDSTALSGSASLPTSTTYVDLGSAKLMGRVTWEEVLDSGDVTVDVYGSDNGTSDAAGASVTGLTDPAGSDCSAAGSHRYWRVVMNFTRTLTTQEPTVSRIALAQTAAGGGGSVFGGGVVR